MATNYSDGFIPMRCVLLVICLSSLPLILNISFFITYFSLGVNYLVTDYSLRALCPESYLWEYVLVSVIFSPLFIIHFILKKHTNTTLKTKFRVLIFSVLCYLGTIVLGGFGLYDYNLSCGSDGEDLWKFGITSFILQLMYLFYCFICYLEYILPEEEEEPNEAINVESENPSPDSEELENNVFIDEPPYIGQVTEI